MTHDAGPRPAAPAPTPPAAPGKPAAAWRPERRSVVTVAVAVVALLAAVAFLGLHGGTRTVTATLSLSDTDSSGLAVDESCEGTGGYADISPGAQAVLSDGSGTTVATAELGEGRFDGVGCVFHFTFTGVPKADFYALDLGYTTRGDLRYSYDDMVRRGWALDLSLGD